MVFSAAIERQALCVRAGRVVGKAQAILHVQARAVIPDHARVGPQEAFVAVGEAVAHAVHAHGHGQQSGDEVDQVHIMASDIGERVGVRRGHPVLEIGVAVIPFLDQARGAQPELAERACAILAARHQAAVVEALVIFDGDEQTARARLALDLRGVTVLKRQRLHRTDVLIAGERGHHDVVMKLVGHRHYYDLARRKRGDGFAEQVRLRRAIAIRPGAEGLAWERAQQCFRARQPLHGRRSATRTRRSGRGGPGRCM